MQDAAPTTNTDGSPLTDVVSYRVYYSTTDPPCPGGRVLTVDAATARRGGQAMALAPANNTPTVTIDLHRIRQSDYHGFRGNEYVRVVGFILRPSRRIQAFQIYLVTPWFPTEPP